MRRIKVQLSTILTIEKKKKEKKKKVLLRQNDRITIKDKAIE
jgi:hypothetical protein